MSKPSGTNHPKTFRMNFLLYVSANSQSDYSDYSDCSEYSEKSENTFGWLWSECSPLPIPNREVKPHIADDTALVCGKVSRRPSFTKEFQSGLLFLLCLLPCHGNLIRFPFRVVYVAMSWQPTLSCLLTPSSFP